MKKQTCEGMLVFLEGMRGLGADVDAEIQNALEQIPLRPEWATASEAERTATLEGIQDAADGQCS
ncbi:hypothetical protein [Nocardia noduli]|uniref:hypothetical protein n=1 Tax=Nocardia noduli TaxID=2815722 RepID=UPI001C214CC4|nr:hypothetical protein [Nocardia noduli]